MKYIKLFEEYNPGWNHDETLWDLEREDDEDFDDGETVDEWDDDEDFDDGETVDEWDDGDTPNIPVRDRRLWEQ